MTEFIQIIDYEGNFTQCSADWLQSKGLLRQGFDYSVITVLGCQSSGKSTLLNALFGTDFPVMDASLGRCQTTKGIWMAKDTYSPTIVFDVEGTDSRERGEDRLTFEHRTALFSLALADCVLVNMWYHDLGRYTASNYGLFKTVLGVNLELFQKSNEFPKTTMIFVIRDYTINMTPLEKLEQMIQDDIRHLWKETPKPPQYTHSTADDFLKFRIVGLPSKIERPDEFISCCLSFREKWLNQWRPQMYTRGIPSDGFSHYVQAVWETILKTSDLDIPSQKEMLATYRCDELKTEALTSVAPEIQHLMDEAKDNKLSSQDISWARRIAQLALERFDPSAFRYEAKIYKAKRIQLIQGLQGDLQKVADIHLTTRRHNISEACYRKFYAKLNKISEQGDIFAVCLQYRDTTEEWKKQAMNDLLDGMKIDDVETHDEDLRQHLQFNTSQHEQALKENLDALIIRFHEYLLQELEKDISRKVEQSLNNLESYLTTPELTPQGFWSHVTKQVEHIQQLLAERLSTIFSEFDKSEIKKHANDSNVFLSHIIFKQLLLKMKPILDYLLHSLLRRFQLFFTQDAQQVPRQWQHLTCDQIKDIYIDARKNSLAILSIFTEIHCSGLFGDLKDLETNFIKEVKLSESKKEEILLKAEVQMQKSYQEAQMLQAASGQGVRIPWWIWTLLVALGFNEMVMVFTSPFVLILLILATLVFCFSFYTGNLNFRQCIVQRVFDLLSLVWNPFSLYVEPFLSSSTAQDTISEKVSHTKISCKSE